MMLADPESEIEPQGARRALREDRRTAKDAKRIRKED